MMLLVMYITMEPLVLEIAFIWLDVMYQLEEDTVIKLVKYSEYAPPVLVALMVLDKMNQLNNVK